MRCDLRKNLCVTLTSSASTLRTHRSEIMHIFLPVASSISGYGWACFHQPLGMGCLWWHSPSTQRASQPGGSSLLLLFITVSVRDKDKLMSLRVVKGWIHKQGFSLVCSPQLLSIIRLQHLSPEFNKDPCCQAVNQHSHPQASGQGPQPWPTSSHSSLSFYPCLCCLIFQWTGLGLKNQNRLPQ